jgi:hypothetical protein
MGERNSIKRIGFFTTKEPEMVPEDNAQIQLEVSNDK